MLPTSSHVELTEESLTEINFWGELRAPNEACGLLLSQPYQTPRGRWTRVLEIQNSSTEPETSYQMDGSEIERVMEGKPDQTVAVWHTHPGGLIGPSTGDMKNRPDPEVPMLVVTLTVDGPIPSWF